jgi:non-SMC mitotic condensation complex subunit 1
VIFSRFTHAVRRTGNNPIYNLLPDVLSCLSRNETVTKPQFRAIMRYLLAFISKDKQSESLVDKLSNRFQTTDGVMFRAPEMFVSLLPEPVFVLLTVQTLFNGGRLPSVCRSCSSRTAVCAALWKTSVSTNTRCQIPQCVTRSVR